ncbi:DUF1566 domain-containing protein [Candidatus Woesearchaeota archaeon]|nr:DUF1566 domain-containing protein [Candidatus Woesearchaeota archaeon]
MSLRDKLLKNKFTSALLMGGLAMAINCSGESEKNSLTEDVALERGSSQRTRDSGVEDIVRENVWENDYGNGGLTDDESLVDNETPSNNLPEPVTIDDFTVNYGLTDENGEVRFVDEDTQGEFVVRVYDYNGENREDTSRSFPNAHVLFFDALGANSLTAYTNESYVPITFIVEDAERNQQKSSDGMLEIPILNRNLFDRRNIAPVIGINVDSAVAVRYVDYDTAGWESLGCLNQEQLADRFDFGTMSIKSAFGVSLFGFTGDGEDIFEYIATEMREENIIEEDEELAGDVRLMLPSRHGFPGTVALGVIDISGENGCGEDCSPYSDPFCIDQQVHQTDACDNDIYVMTCPEEVSVCEEGVCVEIEEDCLPAVRTYCVDNAVWSEDSCGEESLEESCGTNQYCEDAMCKYTSSFVDNGDGTVRDDETGNVWQKGISPEEMSRRDGIIYCEDLSLGGSSNWRLPTIGELRTLVIGCPDTALGGSCNVSEDDCTDYWGCRDSSCGGCERDSGPDGCYFPREFSNSCNSFWSSTFETPVRNAWGISYRTSGLWAGSVNSSEFIKCIKED